MNQVAGAMQGLVSLLARLMIAAVFLASLGNKIPHFKETAEYMSSEGIPNPIFALVGAIGLLVLGGVSVVLGAWTRIGALFLFTFIAAATFYFHDFWRFEDIGQRQLQTIQFMKNMAIGGGLLMLAAFGGGAWSIDGWIGMKREEAEAGASKPRVTAKPQQG